jgi:hypothetical protein
MTGHILAYLVCAALWGFVLYWTVVLIADRITCRRKRRERIALDLAQMRAHRQLAAGMKRVRR